MKRRTFLLALATLPAWAQPEVDRLAYLLAGQPVYFLSDGLRSDLQVLGKHVKTVEEIDGFLQTHPQERARYLRIMHGLFDEATAWRCVPFAHRPGSPPARAQNWGAPYE